MFIALMRPDLWQKRDRKKEKDTEDLVIKRCRDLSGASRCQSPELQGRGFRNSGNSVGIYSSWVGRNVGTTMIFLRRRFSQPEAMTPKRQLQQMLGPKTKHSCLWKTVDMADCTRQSPRSFGMWVSEGQKRGTQRATAAKRLCLCRLGKKVSTIRARGAWGCHRCTFLDV